MVSFLCFVVLDGCGELAYEGNTYFLKKGDCVFIDCRKAYSHRTGVADSADTEKINKLWSLQWCHFYAPFLPAVYEKYKERGGRPVFHPKNLAKFRELFSEEEAVVICPVDPYVEDDYFKTIEALGNRAAESEANLVLMGIEPTYPSEKYGYIIPKSKENISEVSMFKEKPTAEVAEGYISQGALWNGGVFAFRLGYVLKRAHELIDFKNYDDLFAKYNTLKKISFDYAVVEHEPLIEVMRFSGTWKDLGTWNTLTEAMDSNNVGEALFNEKCENVHVVNELNMPVLCMGLKDVVVSASPEGILVSDKEQSSYIKPFVETFNKQVMFAEKSWGSFRVLDVEKESLTIKVTLNPGHKMNYHSHTNRDEVWTVVSGTGYTIIDGQKQIVRPGDVLRMPAGCKHTIVADTELQVIEVQMGKDISVHDKEKFELAL